MKVSYLEDSENEYGGNDEIRCEDIKNIVAT